MIEIKLPLEGGCLCGAVRYELRAAPYMVYLCHCADCKRQSGGPFTLSMPAAKKDLFVVAGSCALPQSFGPAGRFHGPVRKA